MRENCVLFTVGPVEMSPETLAIGAVQPPYFRTEDFSALMLEAESRYLELTGAPEGSRAVFLSCSGTGGMEAMVAGLLTGKDRALVIDGGSFGHRFVELCAHHGVPTEILSLEPGQALTSSLLESASSAGLTALLVNLHETSTGTLYPLPLLSDYCGRHGLLLLVDGVSSFIAEETDMARWGVDAFLTASQKALACAPGMALLALSPRAAERALALPSPCYYLSLRAALENGRRGQSPFTLTESVMLQVAFRLGQLMNGGLAAERAAMAAAAAAFRLAIGETPLRLLSQNPSHGVTALCPRPGVSAYGLFETLRREYQLCVCPNGGSLRDTVFRVGHMGALTRGHYQRLLDAFLDLERRGLL